MPAAWLTAMTRQRRTPWFASAYVGAAVFAVVLSVAPPRGAATADTEDGDAARGQTLYEARCTACHSIDADRVGPRHRGVFGQRAGSVPGYGYSRALERSGLTWDAATLDRWLAAPTRLVPGTRMGTSVPDRRDRRDIIAFLRSAAVSEPAAQGDE